jgi:hypothetical protein
MNTTLIPERFKPILWSYDLKRLDPIKHKRTIILAAINYGDLWHWRWLIKHYGENEIRRTLQHLPASSLRVEAARLAKLIFKVKEYNYAPRGIRTRS